LALGLLLGLYAAGSFAQSGYAALVRRVAPSVVTVLVQEQDEDAGQRAADQVAAKLNDDGMRAIRRRLVAGPDVAPEPVDGGSVLGSGFVIRSDGLIVTNRHVVAGARKVQVRFSDGREVPAQVLGADAATDIALLKVSARALPALRLGSAQNVAVGDAVIAIGNPFGLGQSVSAGIISARGRTLEDDPYIDFLQTDAAINHGNSGGPLLAVDGTVVGVTSVIFSPTGASIGLGFAIPAETIAAVAAEIEAHGRVDRGFLGINAQAVTAGIATALGLPAPGGAMIAEIEPDGPAAGKLAVGDVLLSIGSTPVHFEDLSKVIVRLKPDTPAEIVVLRDGVQRTMVLKIGRLPDPPATAGQPGGADTWVRNLAIGVADTSVQIRKSIRADSEPNGLIVTQLRRAGIGAQAGLLVGDLITQAGTMKLNSVADLASVSKPTAQLPLLLRVMREGSAHFVAVTGGEAP
jgi:serine protease Do